MKRSPSPPRKGCRTTSRPRRTIRTRVRSPKSARAIPHRRSGGVEPTGIGGASRRGQEGARGGDRSRRRVHGTDLESHAGKAAAGHLQLAVGRDDLPARPERTWEVPCGAGERANRSVVAMVRRLGTAAVLRLPGLCRADGPAHSVTQGARRASKGRFFSR